MLRPVLWEVVTSARTLYKQRGLTDQKLADFTAYANSHGWQSLPENLQQVYQSVVEQMSQRSSIQARVDQKNIPLDRAIGYYTRINAMLLGLFNELFILLTINPLQSRNTNQVSILGYMIELIS